MYPDPTTDNSVAYYRSHAPAKALARVGLNAWKPILKAMIEDHLTLDEIHEWMTEHHKVLNFQLPAKTTVRDWLGCVRKEIGKPLRQRSKSPGSAIQYTAPEAFATQADPSAELPTAAPSPSEFHEPKPDSVLESTGPKEKFHISQLKSMTPEEREARLLGDAIKREGNGFVLRHPKTHAATPEEIKKVSERLNPKPKA